MTFWPEPEFKKAKITFTLHKVKPTLPDKRKLRKWITSVFESEDLQGGDVTFIFCTDEYLLEINRKFLQHDYYTDIITFPLSDSPVSGEIYISWDRVKENARTRKIPVERELLRVMVHGVLHLCGYDDHSPAEKRQMRRRETASISAFYDQNAH